MKAAWINSKDDKENNFKEMDFSNYLSEYYKKYNADVYCDLYTHSVRIILLENEINGTLIFDKDKYTFVVKDNVELLFMLVSQDYWKEV